MIRYVIVHTLGLGLGIWHGAPVAAPLNTGDTRRGSQVRCHHRRAISSRPVVHLRRVCAPTRFPAMLCTTSMLAV